MLTHPADWALLIGAAVGSSSPSPPRSPPPSRPGSPPGASLGTQPGALLDALPASPPNADADGVGVGFVGPLGCSRLPRDHASDVEATHPPHAPAHLPDVGYYLGRTAQPSTQPAAAANANANANAAGPAATVAGLSGATLHTLAPPSRVARLARTGVLAASAATFRAAHAALRRTAECAPLRATLAGAAAGAALPFEARYACTRHACVDACMTHSLTIR